MRTIYLGAAEERVIGHYHEPVREDPGAHAVVVSPPFGWDEVCSYRARRALADHLAAAGHAVLRIELPGTGDSPGGPRDEDLVGAWLRALETAGAWCGGERPIAGIGIGIGGLLLAQAMFDGLTLDALALWAVPARGQDLVRELRAFSRLEDGGADPADADGSLRAGGFLLSAQTRESLRGIDLRTASGAGAARRALLLERDGLAPDEELIRRLRGNGIAVEVQPGPGYAAMMAKPHLSRAPREVFETLRRWLAADPRHSSPEGGSRSVKLGVRGAPKIATASSIELAVEGGTVRETPVEVPTPSGNLFAVVAEQPGVRSRLCCVMLNAGAIRRIGPNRMWVEAARRWAARGVASVRVDLEGIGDAGGAAETATELAELYADRRVDQVALLLDSVGERWGWTRFLSLGLCSGAYWSFHTALRDERVGAALLLNPQALYWEPDLEAARDFRRGALRPQTWSRLLRGDVEPARIQALARRAPSIIGRYVRERRVAENGPGEVLRAFQQLRESNTEVSFYFSGREPLHEELEREGVLSQLDRWPNVTLGELPGEVHTLRPVASQRAGAAAIDRSIERELARVLAATPLVRSS